MALDHLHEELSVEQVKALADAGEIELVDVREPYEHEAGHIEGARHVQPAELSAFAQSLAPERPVVFYCRVGSRSAGASQAFRASGFNAHTMAGGLVAWDAAGLPIAPAGGTVAPH